MMDGRCFKSQPPLTLPLTYPPPHHFLFFISLNSAHKYFKKLKLKNIH